MLQKLKLNILNVPKQVRKDILKKGMPELFLHDGKSLLSKGDVRHSLSREKVFM